MIIETSKDLEVTAQKKQEILGLPQIEKPPQIQVRKQASDGEVLVDSDKVEDNKETL